MFRTSLFAALAVLTLPAPTLAQTVAERWQAAQNTCHDDEAIIRARFSACSTAIDLGAAPASGATADDMTSALLTRTQIHIHMEDYSHAIADADRAATYVEKFTRVHHARCWARGLAGVELDVALAACNRSFEIHWSDTETYNARGLVYLRLENWEAAYKDFNQIAEYRFHAYAQYGAGLAQLAMGNTKEGEALVRRALQRDRTAGDVLNSLGYTPDYMKSVAAQN